MNVWVVVVRLPEGGFSRPLGVFSSKKGAKALKYRPGGDPSKFELYKMELQEDDARGSESRNG